MSSPTHYTLRAIGFVRSQLTATEEAPKQGSEGAPSAWIEIDPDFRAALHGIATGNEIIALTWLHLAQRDTLRVHPRDDPRNPLTGVFATRSADRPNPIGLHPVRVLEISAASGRLRVEPLEAIDGTPVIDIKTALPPVKK